MNKHIPPLLHFAIATVLLVLICFTRLITSVYYNTSLNEHYLNGGEYRDDGVRSMYEQGVPLEEIDMNQFIIDRQHSYNSLCPDEAQRETILPIDVDYYENVDGKFVHAFTLKAGTAVLDMNKTQVQGYKGYGGSTVPTYWRGWRYTRAFVLADGENIPIADRVDPRIQNLPFYYVKSEQIYQLNEFLWADRPGYDLWEVTYVADIIMYREGTYCSPDLYHPYFDTANIILLSSAGVLLFAYIVLRVRHRKT